MKDAVKKAAILRKEEDRKEQATTALADLGNPWDNVPFVEKKRFGLHYYYQAIQANPAHGCHREGLIESAEKIGVTPNTILAWVTEYEGSGEIQEDKRGKSSPTISPMDDEDFKNNLREFVKVKKALKETNCSNIQGDRRELLKSNLVL